MAVVRHVGFVLRLLGTTNVVVFNLYAQFGCNRPCSFEDASFNVMRAWLENACSRHFGGCFEVKMWETKTLHFNPSTNAIIRD